MKDNDLKYILRANDGSKPLSRSARDLTANYFDMIKKSPNGIIFVDHEFISGITEVSIHQNKMLHKQLRDLFDIQYHKSVRVDGKKLHFGFTVQFTKNGEAILENPKQFYVKS